MHCNRLFIALALLALAALTIADINVVSITHSTSEISIGRSLAFEATLFIVDFDQDIALPDGTPISQLDLSIPNGPDLASGIVEDTAGDSDLDMPEAMTRQMGVVRLTCACPGCQVVDPVSCNGTHCTWDSFPAAAGNSSDDGAPRWLIPFPAVTEPVMAVFSVFAGTSVRDGAIKPVPKRFVAAKILRDFNSWSGQWVTYVDEDLLDLDSCRFRFYTEADPSPTGNYLKQAGAGNGTFVSQETPPAVNQAPLCNYTKLVEEIDDMFAAVEDIALQSNKDAMEGVSWTLAAFISRDTWSSCHGLLQSMLVEGESEHGFQGIIPASVEGQCATPERSSIVLERYLRNQEEALKCQAQVGCDPLAATTTHLLARSLDKGPRF